MTDIYLDPTTGDIDLTNNTMRLTQTVEELTRQRLSITLQAYKGEWIFNILFGVPYLKNDNNPTQLLGKGTQGLLDVELKRVILNTEGVLSLDEYESSLNQTTREFFVAFKATTEEGPIVFSDTLTI